MLGRVFSGLAVLALVAAARAEDCARLRGLVIDGSGEPLPLCHATLVDLGRWTSSGPDGRFSFLHVPPGPHRLRVTRLGYRDRLLAVELQACDTLDLTLRLEEAPLAMGDLTVEGHGERLERLHDPALALQAAQLQREGGATLAEALDGQTGVSSRSMGPAPARPVLRGHSGDRLLLLEDGASTGDLSATSADHAVAIDPLSARRVEWIRGAETLLHAPGAAGGVLDVDRGLVPDEARDGLAGSLALGSASGNRSLDGALRLDGGSGGSAWTLDGTWRRADDMDTPTGRLGNSSLATAGLSAGLSAIGDAGHLGLAGTVYESDYGIPGGFVGGHPNGVDISMQRRNLRIAGRRLEPGAGLRFLAGSLSLARYHHAEYESSGLLGVEFGVLDAELRLDAGLGSWWRFTEGRLRLEAELRDFATGGLSHAPDTDESRLALAWLEHATFGDGWHLRAALRGDARRLDPGPERVSLVVGHIRERSFAGISGALQLDAPPCLLAGWQLEPSACLQRSWRAPTVEELFSGGPHLAAYSYEVGNPELGAETGWLSEAGLELRRGGLRARLSGYLQVFDGYVFPSFTGRFSARRADLYEYRSEGRDARIAGIELDGGWSLEGWRLAAGGSWTRGDLVGGGPLPAMPPASGRLDLERLLGAWTAGLRLSGALPQDQVYRAEDPGALPEEATAGWLRLDLDLSWRAVAGGRLQQLDLRLENVLDLEYRNHLSRVRSVMPEAGRSLRASWRLWW